MTQLSICISVNSFSSPTLESYSRKLHNIDIATYKPPLPKIGSTSFDSEPTLDSAGYRQFPAYQPSHAMAKPDLTLCIKLLVMETDILCSKDANKISADENLRHGWLLSSHRNSRLSTFA